MTNKLLDLPDSDGRNAIIPTDIKEDMFNGSGKFDIDPVIDYIETASVKDIVEAILAGNYGYDKTVWKELFPDKYDDVLIELEKYKG